MTKNSSLDFLKVKESHHAWKLKSLTTKDQLKTTTPIFTLTNAEPPKIEEEKVNF